MQKGLIGPEGRYAPLESPEAPDDGDTALHKNEGLKEPAPLQNIHQPYLRS